MTLSEIIPRESGIYGIQNTQNGKWYVGSAVDFKKRVWNHLTGLRGGYHHSKKLQNSWNKHGEDSFQFHILAHYPPEYLIKMEQWFIDNLQAYGEGYNMRPKAESNLGKTVSDETKEKISNSKKANPTRHWLGAKRPEVLAWIIPANTGRPGTDKQKEAVRKANLGNKRLVGYKQTPEHVANSSKGRTGLLRYPYTGQFLLTNLKTKEETLFPDMWQAVNFLECDKRSMQAVIRGKREGIYNHSIQIIHDSQ